MLQDVRKKHGPKMDPHLHMEIRRHGELIEPADLVPVWESQRPGKAVMAPLSAFQKRSSGTLAIAAAISSFAANGRGTG